MRSKPISYIARLWILPLLLALFSASLQAQGPGKDSWDNLNRLQAGQKIQVVQMDMKSLKGRFLGFSEKAISVRIKKDEVTIQRPNVLRVILQGGGRSKNALTGLVIGAVAGLVLGAIVDHKDDLDSNDGKIFAPLVFGGGGAALGSVFPGFHTIYRAKRIKRGTHGLDFQNLPSYREDTTPQHTIWQLKRRQYEQQSEDADSFDGNHHLFGFPANPAAWQRLLGQLEPLAGGAKGPGGTDRHEITEEKLSRIHRRDDLPSSQKGQSWRSA